MIRRATHRKLALGTGAKLYALDAYIRHDDRTAERPNALLWRDEIVAIDHGSAFAWLDRAGHTGDSVAALTTPMPGAVRHVLRDALVRAKRRLSFAEFERRMRATLDAQIDAVARNCPSELDIPVRRGARGLATEMLIFLKARRARVAEVVRGAWYCLGGSP